MIFLPCDGGALPGLASGAAGEVEVGLGGADSVVGQQAGHSLRAEHAVRLARRARDLVNMLLNKVVVI